MKYQQVSVDFWSMGQTMFIYGILAVMVWLMLRLIHVTLIFPRHFRSDQENIQRALKEMQKRFPDINLSEDEIANLEDEVAKMLKEDDQNVNKETKEIATKPEATEESKKEL